MTNKHAYNAWTIYRRVLQQIRPHGLGVSMLALSALGALPIALLTPLPLKIVVDSVLGSHPLPLILDPIVPHWVTVSPGATLWLATALMLVVALLGQVLRLGNWIPPCANILAKKLCSNSAASCSSMSPNSLSRSTTGAAAAI